MRIHFFPSYTIISPSSRTRCYNLHEELKARGYDCRMSSHILPSNTLDIRVPAGVIGRISDLARVRSGDVVIVYKGTFQVLNPELFLLMKKLIGFTLIFDFDDAIHLDEESRNASRESTERMIGSADGVSAGCGFLSEFALKHNENVTIIRGNVDTGSYPEKDYSGEKVVIGWIGTRGNLKYLSLLEDPLKKLASEYDNIELMLITDLSQPELIPDLKGIVVRLVKWTLEFHERLKEFDIGLIPLFDTKWEQGKSGGKVIDYMAAGIPIVSSPVGPHNEIIESGKNGFFANSEDEWYNQLKRLIDDRSMRDAMGKAGRQMAEEHYSRSVYADNFLKLIDRTLERTRGKTLSPKE